MVRQVSLGLSRTASFEISVAGWMELQSETQSTLDDLHKIAPYLVQCFYGAAETELGDIVGETLAEAHPCGWAESCADDGAVSGQVLGALRNAGSLEVAR